MSGPPALGTDPWYDEIVAWVHEEASLGASSKFVRSATDYGLGGSTVSVGDALASSFADMAANPYQAPGMDRAGPGGILVLPAGDWVCQNSGGALVRLPMVAPNGRSGDNMDGDIHIFGQARGGTRLLVPSDCGLGTVTCTAASRSDNVITVTTSGPHGLHDGDIIAIKMFSLWWTWNHVTVMEEPTVANQFKYAYGAAAAAGGTPVDAMMPGTSGPSAVIHKIGGLILPFDFSQTRRFWLHNLTIDLRPPGAAGGYGEDGATDAHTNNPWSPSRGFGVLANARVCMVNADISHAWAGTVNCGTKLSSMMLAAGATPSPQNTDHFYLQRCSWIANRTHKLFVSNSAAAGGATGGTRDFSYRDCNSGTAQHSDFCVSDDASLAVLNNDIYHGKSAAFPIYGEAIQGSLPKERLLIDILIGSMKFESPGNCAMFWDHSRRRTVFKTDDCQIRAEVAVNVNGNNNANDTTYKPWAVSTSLAITPNVQTVTGLPTGHGLRVGDPIFVGLPADRNSALNVGGVVKTLVGANSVTFDRPDYDAAGGAIAATAALAGTGGGVRCGQWDTSHPKLSINQSGSAKMGRSAFFWDFQFPPNMCKFEASLEQNSSGDGIVPSVQCESEAPAGLPGRSIWLRGSRTYELMFHDDADTQDILAGDLVELRGSHRLFRSTATRVHMLVGVAQQNSDNALSVKAVAVGSGTGGANPGRIHVWRDHLWVALPGSALTRSDASGGANISGAAADGDMMFDNGDGKHAKYNGTDTGKRLVGQLFENPVSAKAGIRTMPEQWT